MFDARADIPLTVTTPPPLPIDKMVRGQDVHEAAALLPRIFNLCREAQAVAARAAFGLPRFDGWQTALHQEILREHVAKVALKWPALLCIPSLDLPRDWLSDTDGLRRVLFGPGAVMPRTPAGFARFLVACDGVAPVLAALSELFPPGVATRQALPATDPDIVFSDCLQDNSIAARHAGNAVMRCVEDRWGRGPLWCATALCLDLDDILQGHLPAAHLMPGCALVPAARGLYGIQAVVRDGRVAEFRRVTPTDHLLQPGGVMTQCLATLPATQAHELAPVLLAVLDPCVPVTLSEGERPDA